MWMKSSIPIGLIKHRMDTRYKISPQIKCYDAIGESFAPYLMRKDNANKEFASVTTNKYGFRNTVDHHGNIIDFDKVFAEQEKNFGVVLGSSAVFGTGASNDTKSIPSRLSGITKSPWLNFGGRAYNSTQELINLSLHLRAKPKDIVVFSGVNNLTLAYLCKQTSEIYNSFFGESEIRKAINSKRYSDKVGFRWMIAQIARVLLVKFRLAYRSNDAEIRKNISEDYSKILTCFERDLFSLKAIAEGHGSSLTFFMQPLATWLDKTLSLEEQQLFEYLDDLNPSFKILSEFLGNWKKKYFSDIERICAKVGVPFFNLNSSMFESSDWLFVDRVHLSDEGYKRSACFIAQSLGI